MENNNYQGNGQNGYPQNGSGQYSYTPNGQNGYYQYGPNAYGQQEQGEYRHPQADYLYGQQVYNDGYVRTEGLSAHMTKIFGLMVVGLLISAVIAVVVQLNIGVLFAGGAGKFIIGGAVILELVLVFAIAGTLGAKEKPKTGLATGLFILYSAVTGITLAVITFGFSLGSIIHAFVVCALFFTALCIVGHLTNYRILKYGRMLMFGLIFLIVAELISMIFFPFSTSRLLFDVAGVALFSFYTVYDFQAIKYTYSVAQTQEQVKAGVVMGALSLYLDFINLFIRLLSILGNRD